MEYLWYDKYNVFTRVIVKTLDYFSNALELNYLDQEKFSIQVFLRKDFNCLIKMLWEPQSPIVFVFCFIAVDEFLWIVCVVHYSSTFKSWELYRDKAN